MKQVRGFWLPEYEQHLVAFLQTGPEFAAGPTYQLHKLMSAMPHIRTFRHGIDIGGHCGLWSRVMAQMFRNLDAFEPIEAHRECFKLNLAGKDNVVLHDCALGEAPGRVHLLAHMTVSAKSQIARGKGSTGDTHVVPKGYGDVEAEIKTLDSFSFKDVDFVKIDCEGFEYFICKGGEETIRRDKPCIVVEQKPGHGERYGLSQTQAVTLLQSWGAVMMWEISGDYCLKWK